MSDILTVDVLMNAWKQLPPRRLDTRPVRYGNGQTAFDIPISSIVPAVLSRLIEWDEGSSAFYLTFRAEHELLAHHPAQGAEP